MVLGWRCRAGAAPNGRAFVRAGRDDVGKAEMPAKVWVGARLMTRELHENKRHKRDGGQESHTKTNNTNVMACKRTAEALMAHRADSFFLFRVAQKG